MNAHDIQHDTDLRFSINAGNTGTIDIDDAFDQLVEPVAVKAPTPRCADGHGTLTHLFFSDAPLDIARAKAICGKCQLADDCLTGALDRAEPWGVWGGQLIENGRVVVNKRPRGRPPKNPRPELVLDEDGIATYVA